MWVFSKIGFFSVVKSETESCKVLIRARAREDLVALKKEYFKPYVRIFVVPGSDYAFRMVVWKDEWATAIAHMAMEIDYPNFKDAVPSRKRLYGEVWLTMSELQKIPPYANLGHEGGTKRRQASKFLTKRRRKK